MQLKSSTSSVAAPLSSPSPSALRIVTPLACGRGQTTVSAVSGVVRLDHAVASMAPASFVGAPVTAARVVRNIVASSFFLQKKRQPFNRSFVRVVVPRLG